MVVSKGDKLKLKKPIGNLKNVGDTFEVYCVDDKTAYLRCKYGEGVIAIDGIEDYFEIIKEEKPLSDCKFVVGELITLVKEDKGLEPMKKWDFFEVEEITPTGVVRLFCHADEKVRYVSTNVINEFFDSGVVNPNVVYEDGTNTPTPLAETIKVENNQAKAVKKIRYFKGAIKVEFEMGREMAAANEDCDVCPHAEECPDAKLSPYHMSGYIQGEEVEVSPYGVQEDYIDKMLAEAEVKVEIHSDKCTVVIVTLTNGFVMTASSSCVSDENYSEEIGVSVCMDKIKNQLWKMEAYFLHKITEFDKQKISLCIDIIDNGCDDYKNCIDKDCV